MKKALIAMSGGVDSSVAAWLMKKEGYDCIGAMMKLSENANTASADDGSGKKQQVTDDAHAIAKQLDMPYYVFDLKDQFFDLVIKRFVDSYQNGLTPNPCIECNRNLKFGLLLKRSLEYGCDCMATGHYAQIENSNGRYLLRKGTDAQKDQSYVLYSLTQDQLAMARFPLGKMTKTEVREIAIEQGFANANKNESQDICFVPDGKYANFIEKLFATPLKKGRITDKQSNDLGEHCGVYKYTIGQRKGLGLSSKERMYVIEIDPLKNAIIVGKEDELYSSTLTARSINLIAVDKLNEPLKVTAKIRYNQNEQPATVWQLDDDMLRVEFDKPQRAATNGQSVVLYDHDMVIGGGTIASVG